VVDVDNTLKVSHETLRILLFVILGTNFPPIKFRKSLSLPVVCAQSRFVSTFNFLTVLDDALRADRAGAPAEVARAAERWAARLLVDGWWDWHLWPQARGK
jgi:hypothetical protein